VAVHDRAVLALAGVFQGKAQRSLPNAGESNPLDTPSSARRAERSSVEPTTEQAVWKPWVPFMRPPIQSWFVGMCVPFEQTIGMSGIADHRTRIFTVTLARPAEREASVVRIKDENQEKWLVTATDRPDALTTYVQFAKSLLSVVDSQAALERTDASSTIECDVRQETVNGTRLTLRIAFAVTHDQRPIVRLFALAPNGENSLLWSRRSSEVVSSASRLDATHEACSAREYGNGLRLLRSSMKAGPSASFAETLHRNTRPVTHSRMDVLARAVSVCATVREARFWHAGGNELLSGGSRAPSSSPTKSRRSASPTSLERTVRETKVTDASGAWRDSLQGYGSRTVSSYSRWSLS
jgi:hypothetical protein